MNVSPIDRSGRIFAVQPWNKKIPISNITGNYIKRRGIELFTVRSRGLINPSTAPRWRLTCWSFIFSNRSNIMPDWRRLQKSRFIFPAKTSRLFDFTASANRSIKSEREPFLCEPLARDLKLSFGPVGGAFVSWWWFGWFNSWWMVCGSEDDSATEIFVVKYVIYSWFG